MGSFPVTYDDPSGVQIVECGVKSESGEKIRCVPCDDEFYDCCPCDGCCPCQLDLSL